MKTDPLTPAVIKIEYNDEDISDNLSPASMNESEELICPSMEMEAHESHDDHEQLTAQCTTAADTKSSSAPNVRRKKKPFSKSSPTALTKASQQADETDQFPCQLCDKM